MKIEVTEDQLEAIKSLANDISSMIGCGETDEEWKHIVELIDKILSNNNLKSRDFN